MTEISIFTVLLLAHRSFRFQNELPKIIKKRGKDAHLNHEELVQCMEWKQSVSVDSTTLYCTANRVDEVVQLYRAAMYVHTLRAIYQGRWLAWVIYNYSDNHFLLSLSVSIFFERVASNF